MRAFPGQKLTSSWINKLIGQTERNATSGVTRGTAGTLPPLPRRTRNMYNGPFMSRIAIASDGSATEIQVGQGYIFAGRNGVNWPAINFAETTDVEGNALVEGDYALCFLIDVNPSDGTFDAVNGYGAELAAVKWADIYDIQNATDTTYSTPSPPTSYTIDLQCCSVIIGTFHVGSDGSTFTQWKQRLRGDIYVPIHGYQIGTSLSKSDADYWHHAFSSWDGDNNTGWWVCSFEIRFDMIFDAVTRFVSAHTHDVTGDTDSVATANPDPGHTHSADGDLATGVPSWP